MPVIGQQPVNPLARLNCADHEAFFQVQQIPQPGLATRPWASPFLGPTQAELQFFQGPLFDVGIPLILKKQSRLNILLPIVVAGKQPKTVHAKLKPKEQLRLIDGR